MEHIQYSGAKLQRAREIVIHGLGCASDGHIKEEGPKFQDSDKARSDAVERLRAALASFALALEFCEGWVSH